MWHLPWEFSSWLLTLPHWIPPCFPDIIFSHHRFQTGSPKARSGLQIDLVWTRNMFTTFELKFKNGEILHSLYDKDKLELVRDHLKVPQSPPSPTQNSQPFPSFWDWVWNNRKKYIYIYWSLSLVPRKELLKPLNFLSDKNGKSIFCWNIWPLTPVHLSSLTQKHLNPLGFPRW